MFGMKTLVAYAAILLALIVTSGTSEDIDDTEDLQIADENELTDIEPNYQELLASLQKARENGDIQEIDDKRMASGWKRSGMAAGWKRGQNAAAGWKRGSNAAAGWKRGSNALPGGWKRGQSAAASGWKRGHAAAGWKRDFEVDPIDVDTRAGENWRNNQVKTASGWKRTSRSANLLQQNDDDEP